MAQLRSEELAKQLRAQQAITKPLVHAVVTGGRAVFSQTAPADRMAARLQDLAQRFPNISVVHTPVVTPGDDVKRIAADLKILGVDSMELLFGNYGPEAEFAALASEMDVPLLLNAPYDGLPNADGKRDFDGWCGLQPASKLLSDRMSSYTYIPHAQIGSEVAQQSFGQFTRAATAVRNLTGKRIGQVGGNQPTFAAIECPPSVLASRFGTEVVAIELWEFADRITHLVETEDTMLADEVAAIATRVDISQVPLEAMKKVAAAVIAAIEICIKYKLEAITFRCWDEIMQKHNLMLCLVSGLLLDLGVIVACETDLGGLMTMMMLEGFGMGTRPMFADITIAVLVDGEWLILVWHCGPFAPSNCVNCVAKQGWIIPTDAPAYAFLDGVVEGDCATLVRLCNTSTYRTVDFSLAGFEAPFARGPATLGTHFYVQPKNFRKLERKLTLGPKATVHHFGVVKGEAAHLVNMVGHLMYLPVNILEPDEDEIIGRQTCTGLNPLVP